METIGNTFSSYTYTDTAAEFLEKAAIRFKAHSQKMTYKIFDPEKTPLSQEFEESSYDVIILSRIMHVNFSLQKTLENTRRLLKPGGYLLVSEIINNGPIRIQMMLGALSNWRVGVDNGRKSGPTATLATWHDALRKAGFSGLDTTTPEVDGLTWPLCIIASQAVDSRINYLRKPLSSSPFVQLGELVILGNRSLKTFRLAEEIRELVEGFCDKVTILEDLPVDDDDISPMTTFINLVDLDEPIFKNVTEEKMESLKCLFELSKKILWVTQGARADEPYHNASIGFGRSIAYEIPHLSLQFLDLADGGHTASRLIAESVLRLAALTEWDNEESLQKKILWSKETELYQEDGQLLLPRIRPNDDQNGRINSSRRSVTKAVNPQSSTVWISQAADTSLVLREEPIPQLPGDERISVQVNYSILSALNVAPETFLFLGIGTDQTTSDTVVTLSDTNSSKIISSISAPANVSTGQESRFLAAIASEFMAGSLVSKVPKNYHVLVHEPGQDRVFASALTRHAAAKDIRIIFSTTKSDPKDPAWIRVGPWTSERVMRKSILAKSSHFLDLAVDDEGKDASLRIRECLPSECRQINVSDLSRPQSLTPTIDNGTILKALKYAVSHAKTNVFDKKPSAIIRSGQISDTFLPKHPTSIVDWTLDKTLTVQVQPINANRLFSKDKTYVLVGLSGQFGQSICEWMSRNGAGYVCLTSRSPRSDEKWQASMKKAGTTVKFLAM